MQIETQSYQLPQYESALLKKQRQAKILSPKVTHVYPEIKQVEKIKLKKHHLDDTEMKQALQYDYEENHLPKQYLFRGSRMDYDRSEYNSRKNVMFPKMNQFINTGFMQTGPENLKLNTEYFESQTNFNPFYKPQKDINNNDSNHFQRQYEKGYQTETNQPSARLKKSISVSNFESSRKNQQEMSQKSVKKINQIKTQADRLTQKIQNQEKQKLAYEEQNVIERYKSESKRSQVEKDFIKLKQKLERERTKEKYRLETELQKLKEETKKIKQQERKRKKSFQEMIEKTQTNKYTGNMIRANSGGVPVSSMQTIIDGKLQKDHLIGEKLHQIEKKYLPKTNIVNKRIQCEIYDPRTDHLRRIQEKPTFYYNDQSDTDSQFSDF